MAHGSSEPGSESQLSPIWARYILHTPFYQQPDIADFSQITQV